VSTPAPPPITADYPDPLWIQAADLIREEVASGVLKPGMRLPPERRLCEQLSVSRVTLRKALKALVDERVLSPSHGRGWYVAHEPDKEQVKEWPGSLESFSETAARMGLTATSRVVVATQRPASLDIAEALGIAPGLAVFHLERVRMLGGVPVALDVADVPAALAPGLLDVDFTTASLYAELDRRGAGPVRSDATIEASESDVAIAAQLDLEPGKPMLVLRQHAFDRDDRTVLVSTVDYVGERYRLRTGFLR